MWDAIAAAVSPLLDDLVAAIVALLLAVGTLALHRAADWLRLSADGEARRYLLDALERALDYGEAEARRRLPISAADGNTDILGAEAAVLAADYVKERVPDALRRLRVDDAGLQRMIEARLPDRLPRQR